MVGSDDQICTAKAGLRHQIMLDTGFDIAGEQQAHAGAGDAEHAGGRVVIGPGTSRDRMKYLKQESVPAPAASRLTRRPRLLVGTGTKQALGRIALQNAGSASAMIGVSVGHQQRVHAPDAERLKGRNHHPFSRITVPEGGPGVV